MFNCIQNHNVNCIFYLMNFDDHMLTNLGFHCSGEFLRGPASTEIQTRAEELVVRLVTHSYFPYVGLGSLFPRSSFLFQSSNVGFKENGFRRIFPNEMFCLLHIIL